MKITKSEPFPWHQMREYKVGFLDSFFINKSPKKIGFYRRMFDEDFTSLIQPRLSGCSELFEVVTNNEPLIQNLLANASNGYSRRSVDETICKLVGEIAHYLINYDRAYFFLHEDSEKKKFYLHSFSAEGVLNILGILVQWIPKRVLRQLGKNENMQPRELRFLSAAKVLKFYMPKQLRVILTRQNKTFAYLDKYHRSFSSFTPKITHDNPKPVSYFNSHVWLNIHDDAFYHCTKETGWNGRKSDSSKRSDFFDCHRLIRFRRLQLILRDSILSQLSNELTRVGSQFKSGFAVKISVTSDLAEIKQLNDFEMRLESEDVEFKEIIDYCRKR